MVLITNSTRPFPFCKAGYKNGILAKYFVLHGDRILFWSINLDNIQYIVLPRSLYQGREQFPITICVQEAGGLWSLLVLPSCAL